MRILGYILTIPLLILLIGFALANRTPVTLNCWPLEFEMQVPLYLVTLGVLGFGCALGGLIAWVAGLPHRLEKMRLRGEVEKLETQLGKLQQHLPVHLHGRSDGWMEKLSRWWNGEAR